MRRGEMTRSVVRKRVKVHHRRFCARLFFRLSCASFIVSAISWVASYVFPITLRVDLNIVYVASGAVDWLHPHSGQKVLWKALDTIVPSPSISRLRFQGWATKWKPSRAVYHTGMIRTVVPLWIPTPFFGGTCCVSLVPNARKR